MTGFHANRFGRIGSALIVWGRTVSAGARPWPSTQSVCLQYLGWVDDSTCVRGNTCTGLVFKQDCHTEF